LEGRLLYGTPLCSAETSKYLLRVNQRRLEMYLKDIKILLYYIHGIKMA